MSARTFQPDRMAGYTLPVYQARTPPEIARGEQALYPVIVVGAGLGGLTAALELGERGVRTVLLDEDDTVGAAGLSSRGICYAKRSLEIFDRFGVAERVRAKGVTWNEGDVYAGLERMYRFNLQPERDQKYPAFVNLQQFYVEQYLVERIMRTPAVDLRWKNRVVDVRPGPDGVEVEVECPDGRYRARCQWLLGADGAHSVVREKLGAKDAESALSEDQWCITDIRMSPSAEVVRKAYVDNPLNAGGAIWYHQMADGIWRTDWQVSQYPDPARETEPGRVTERLKKLLGPDVPFELVWVGPWRFRRRYLERMRHGRVLFLGDAAAQHSPFGARGGNRAIQDANNLAWKLALVLEGKAHEDLIETYDSERGFAARENVEHASRAATFIGPQTHGERLVRNAILDLARADPAMRPLVNVGRLSVATEYADSPLNLERGAPLEAPLAAPGCAAPDGRLGEGYFVDRLQGQFSVAWFGGEAPAPRGAQAIAVPRAGNEALFARYGVPPEGATYVFRPDGHVLARCRGIDPGLAREAIDGVLGYRAGAARRAPPAARAPGRLSPLEADRLYDAFAALLDGSAPEERERTLARLAVLLAGELGDYAKVLAAIDAAADSDRMRAPSGRRE
ncbi:MAG TPA: FAD-dependent monooxygenase [Burkholderiales bacterium]|nr:FAD-dependent monooxygenase [Burkholderiales bacterium]